MRCNRHTGTSGGGTELNYPHTQGRAPRSLMLKYDVKPMSDVDIELQYHLLEPGRCRHAECE